MVIAPLLPIVIFGFEPVNIVKITCVSIVEFTKVDPIVSLLRILPAIPLTSQATLL